MPRFLLVLIFFLLVMVQLPGEKIPLNDGAGWDGTFYREVAAGFLDTIEESGYSPYQMQRILPFAGLNIVYVLLGLDMDHNSLTVGVLVLNLLALILGVYWYFGISDKLRLKPKVETLGFILLFLTFPVLKGTWYAPFTTDLFALVLGLGQVGYFIRDEKYKLFLVSLLGGFVWPTLWLTGLLLIFLPDDALIQKNRPMTFRSWHLVPAAMIMGLFIYLFLNFGIREEKALGELARNILSLAAVLVIAFAAIRGSRLDLTANWNLLQKRLKSNAMVGLFLSLGLFYLAIYLMAVGESEFNLREFVPMLLLRPLVWPFNFLVNHFLYFGLLIPAAIVFYQRTFKQVSTLGMGYATVFFLMLLLALNTESRMSINYLPFLLVPFLKGIKRYDLVQKDIYIILAGNLLLSKFWYSINVPGILEAFESPDTATYMQFPAQRYFQHFGPWQNPYMYLLYGLLFCLALLLVYHGKKRYVKEAVRA